MCGRVANQQRKEELGAVEVVVLCSLRLSCICWHLKISTLSMRLYFNFIFNVFLEAHNGKTKQKLTPGIGPIPTSHRQANLSVIFIWGDRSYMTLQVHLCLNVWEKNRKKQKQTHYERNFCKNSCSLATFGRYKCGNINFPSWQGDKEFISRVTTLLLLVEIVERNSSPGPDWFRHTQTQTVIRVK